MFDLSGKNYIVTGGNRGVGLGFARGLVKAGAGVAIWSRDEEKNAAAVEELKAMGGNALACRCDVTEIEQIQQSFEKTLAHFKTIAGCFANAGVAIPEPATILDLDFEKSAWVRQVNLDGVAMTFKVVANYLVEQGQGGKLIATSSVGSLVAANGNAYYGATKAAVNSLVKTCASELGAENIQVNGVALGYVESDLTRLGGEEFIAYNQQRNVTPFLGEPKHVEGIAVFLASEESAYMTGHTLVLDGGFTTLRYQ